MNATPQISRTLEWHISQRPTINDLRSLIEWLQHAGVSESAPFSLSTYDNQKDGYGMTVRVHD